MAKGIGGAGGPKAGESSRVIPTRPAPAAAEGAQLPTRPCRAENPMPLVDLQANYFGLTFTAESLTVYKYTFKVLGSNDKDIRGATAKDIFKSALERLGALPYGYATDFQHQIVTLKPLKISDKDRTLRNIERFNGCAVEFGHTLQLQLGTSVLASPSLDVIDCLNLIIGHWAREQNQIPTIGSHRFFLESDDSESHIETGSPESMSVIRGLLQNLRPAEDGLLNVKDIYDALTRTTRGSAVELTAALINLHEVIAKVRASYELPGKDPQEVRIVGFARRDDKDSKNRDPAHPLKIDKDFPGSTEVRFWVKNEYRTVWEHFKKERHLEILKHLPLVNIGKPGRPEYVPAEYCRVLKGQALGGKVTQIPRLTLSKLDDLDRGTCQRPKTCHIWVRSVHKPKELNLDPVTNRVLSNFRVSVQKDLLEVTGRKLDSPPLSLLDKKPVTITPKASWNMAGRHFSKGPRIKKSWTWIYFSGKSQHHIQQEAEEGVKQLDVLLKKMCAQGSPPQLINVQDRCIPGSGGIAAIRASLARTAQIKGIELLVVVCPEKLPADTYNALKFFGDIQFGIHTSCVLAKKFRKRGKGQQPWDLSYFSNVALKINLKLGGTNHQLGKDLDLANKSAAALMVVGYDVTHPAEDEKSEAEQGGKTGVVGTRLDVGSKQAPPRKKPLEGIPEKRGQVGLVISAGEDLGQWLSSYWNQRARQEMTGPALIKAFEELLKAWKSVNTANDKMPLLNVVLYRDGVSESQFDRVLQKEVPEIRQAYDKVFRDTKVRITLVVAIKRHATRFFPVNDKDSDKNGNIKPGIVVDNGVTQPKYWEFFLAAHSATQGTANPTRYVVVVDEIFQKEYTGHPVNSAAQIEKFTHDLSYLFGRANKAVSVCAPAYYADILCTRARAYAAALANPETRSEIEKSMPNDAVEKERILAGKTHHVLKKSMYWI